MSVHRAVVLPVAMALVAGACVETNAPLEQVYSIRGTVSLAGTGQSGIQILALNTSGQGTFAFTEALGAYIISGLPNDDYMVFPFHDGTAFRPASRLVTLNNADVNFTSFTSLGGPEHEIAGNAGGSPAAGAIMSLTGDNVGDFFVNSYGMFRVPGLRIGNYTVTPVKPGTTFYPASRDIDGVIDVDHAQSGTIGVASLASVTIDNGATSVSDLFIAPANMVEAQGSVRPKRTTEVDPARVAAYEALWQNAKVVTFTYVINAQNQTFQLNLLPDHTYSASTAFPFLLSERLVGAANVTFSTTPPP